MRRVELLGPSGVGKTFLYRRVCSCEQQKTFLNVEEAYVTAALKERHFTLSFSYLFYVLLKSGFFKWKEKGLSYHILFQEEMALNCSDQYRLSFNVLKNYLLDEEDIEVISVRLKNFIQKVKRNQILENHLDKDQLVFFDEGLLHHHHGLVPDLLNKYPDGLIKTDGALNLEAVVSCELSFEKNIERILNRKKQGIKTFSHARLNGAELEAYVLKNRLEYQMKIELLNKIGVRILHLDMEDDFHVNAERITFFINNLNQLE